MTTNFSAVGMGSEDLTATLAFYRLVGLDIPPEADREPHVEVSAPGTVRLMWDSLPDLRAADPGLDSSEDKGADKGAGLAFDCGSPEEVDRTYARVLDAGHRGVREPWDAFWGQRYACVLDPDGVQVAFFAALTP